MKKAEASASNTKILRWQGALADGGATLRRVTAIVLGLLCVALAFTQAGFIGIQFADGSASYLVFMLVPVALTACLLGTLWGASMGLFSGAVLYLHSVLMPLDYFELTYVTPVTSIVMMTLCGLVLGMLFALVLSRAKSRWMRVLLVALSCLVASCVFSAGFAMSTIALMAAEMLADSGLGAGSELLASAGAQSTQAALFTPAVGFQAVNDAAIMAIVCLVGYACAKRGMRRGDELDLRTMFSAWLGVVVMAAFLAVATAGYVSITAGTLADASGDMRSEVNYLLGQIERAAEYNGEDVGGLLDSETSADEATEHVASEMLANLLDGYTEEEDGLAVTAVGARVIGADAERMAKREKLQDCFDEETLAAADRSASDGTLERVVYEAPSSENDLVDFTLPGSNESFSGLFTRQIGYLVAAQNESYQVILVRPASMVFTARDDVMRWLSFASVALLLVVFLQTRWLLDRMVARRIDATNGVMERIVGGDLAARVDAQGTSEFKALSAGINSTVDALQGWIAEAESRMDAELATAKAIQESALPQVFPPYPDILHFDIYASMDAAREVGGDFYDFFLIGDAGPDAGKLGFVMADVSGKGVPAALFMMKAKTQIRDYLEAGMGLGEAIENANRRLVDGNDASMFVTMWAGVLDYATGHVDFVNAGHNPPLLWQFEDTGTNGADSPAPAGTWRWLNEKSGMPLGLFEGFPYNTYSLECKPGDTFLLYTDGVTEAMSTGGELYGEARLEALAREHATSHPRELVRAVRADVEAHATGAEQSDDITILALEVGVPPEEKAMLMVPADVAELSRVNDFIHAELDRRLCPVRAQNQLDIAVEELFVNVCHYAYKDAGGDVPRTVLVTQAITADPASITVEIIDSGTPFDPCASPDASTADEFASIADVPIGGLGILMAKKSVDEMRYQRSDGSNVVTLVKRW